MNRNLKQALPDAFYAPAPVRKAAFLKRHRRRELGRWELIALQIGYVPRWTWAASLLLFAPGLGMAAWRDEPDLWSASALTPFLAVLAIAENGRSQLHRMEELELACRVPRRSAVLARMAALGLFHLILLGVLTPVLAGFAGILRAGLYLLTPYLLTAALGLELTRRIRGRKGLLACGAAAALVSVLGTAGANMRPALYQRLSLWTAALAAAAVAAAVEIALCIKEMEELRWN